MGHLIVKGCWGMEHLLGSITSRCSAGGGMQIGYERAAEIERSRKNYQSVNKSLLDY